MGFRRKLANAIDNFIEFQDSDYRRRIESMKQPELYEEHKLIKRKLVGITATLATSVAAMPATLVSAVPAGIAARRIDVNKQRLDIIEARLAQKGWSGHDLDAEDIFFGALPGAVVSHFAPGAEHVVQHGVHHVATQMMSDHAADQVASHASMAVAHHGAHHTTDTVGTHLARMAGDHGSGTASDQAMQEAVYHSTHNIVERGIDTAGHWAITEGTDKAVGELASAGVGIFESVVGTKGLRKAKAKEKAEEKGEEKAASAPQPYIEKPLSDSTAAAVEAALTTTYNVVERGKDTTGHWAITKGSDKAVAELASAGVGISEGVVGTKELRKAKGKEKAERKAERKAEEEAKAKEKAASAPQSCVEKPSSDGPAAVVEAAPTTTWTSPEVLALFLPATLQPFPGGTFLAMVVLGAFAVRNPKSRGRTLLEDIVVPFAVFQYAGAERVWVASACLAALQAIGSRRIWRFTKDFFSTAWRWTKLAAKVVLYAAAGLLAAFMLCMASAFLLFLGFEILLGGPPPHGYIWALSIVFSGAAFLPVARAAKHHQTAGFARAIFAAVRRWMKLVARVMLYVAASLLAATVLSIASGSQDVGPGYGWIAAILIGATFGLLLVAAYNYIWNSDAVPDETASLIRTRIVGGWHCILNLSNSATTAVGRCILLLVRVLFYAALGLLILAIFPLFIFVLTFS